MNKLRFCVAAIFCLLLAGCYEVNEEITIDDKGAGTYLAKMDMSTMLQMMQSMGAGDELAKNGLDRTIDTTIFFKNIPDTIKSLTAEQKKLMQDGSMKLNMNAKENVLKADINFPFKSYSALQTLMSGSGTKGLSEAFRNVFSGADNSQALSMQDSEADPFSSIFDVTVNNGLISKKVNQAKYKALMDKPEMAQAKQMLAGYGMEIPYTTVIKLPRPVKKFDNQLIKLSDDKKTATIKYDIAKLFDNADSFSYSIYY